VFSIICAFGCSNTNPEDSYATEDDNSFKLKVSSLEDVYTPHDKTLIDQLETDMGGNTSVRNNIAEDLKWKSKGYFQRNRDLGQVFSLNESQNIRAIILRTGPDDKAVLSGALGASVFLQFYMISGEPVINDNGTPPGTPAKHGFSDNHRCDDYLDRIQYEPLVLYEEGIFPSIPPTYDENGPTQSEEGRLQYLKWELEPTLPLEAGRYAFMVGFTNAGTNRGFTLANRNTAWSPAPPDLSDSLDVYPNGWGLRREGNGQTPPDMVDAEELPEDAGLIKELRSQSLFLFGKARYEINPTCDGYPDVDTYRDFVFAVEIE